MTQGVQLEGNARRPVDKIRHHDGDLIRQLVKLGKTAVDGEAEIVQEDTAGPEALGGLP